MSDYRAIGAATVTLQNLLIDAVREAVPGASVSTGPPPARSEHEQSEGQINVFLYKVEPNAAWRNEELPYRRSDGSVSRRPQLALDLFYLISFYGDDSKQIPDQLLGAAMAALHAEPYPRSHYVPQQAASRDGAVGGSHLAGSGLLKQDHPLSFTLLSNSEDDVIQTWTRLLHSSYVLSVAYIGRVVLIEPELVPEPSLPARRTAIYARGTNQPQLEAVLPAVLPYSVGAELRLVGSNLEAEHVEIAVGDQIVPPSFRSAGELRGLLPEEMQAGTQLVRVVHGQKRAGVLRWDVASNPVAVVIQPVLLAIDWRPVPLLEDEIDDPAEEEGKRVALRLRLAPPSSAAVDVEVLLNRSPTPPEPMSRSGYVLRGTTDPRFPERLELTGTVAPGRYLVRVRIAGIDSALAVDTDPTSPTFERYIGPALDIS